MSALVKSNQHGQPYRWGFGAADAPTFAGFVARGADLKYAPEVKSEATDGEGHADSVVVSKPVNRMITATFTGYVTADWDPTAGADSFNFGGRFYIIDDITEPRKKGDFWEVSIAATSKAGITQ